MSFIMKTANGLLYSTTLTGFLLIVISLILIGCGSGAQQEINELKPPVILFEETENGKTIVLKDGNGRLHTFVADNQWFSEDLAIVLVISTKFDPGENVIKANGEFQDPPRVNKKEKKRAKEEIVRKQKRMQYEKESKLIEVPLEENRLKDLNAVEDID